MKPVCWSIYKKGGNTNYAEHSKQHQQKVKSNFDEQEYPSRIMDPSKNIMKNKKWKEAANE
jgi:hypothetical protein